MDSVSQALWGAVTTQAVSEQKGRIPPWLIGLLAGTLPDLDVLLKNQEDPLFNIIIHRSFSHSLFLIPLGALVVWLVFFLFFKNEKKLYFHYYVLCFVGYGTHSLLDWMTSYGTQLLWPLVNTRYYVDWLSIVDPILTIPWLIVFLIIVFSKKEPAFLKKMARALVGCSLVYMLFCYTQNQKAIEAVYKIAKTRGHQIERVRALPTLGNSFWFRTIYESKDTFYSDAVLVRPFLSLKWRQGESQVKAQWSSVEGDEIIQRLFFTWNWFVDGWFYYEKENGHVVWGDGRYSKTPHLFESLWIFLKDPMEPEKSKMQSSFQEDRKPFLTAFEGIKLIFINSDLLDL